MFVVGFLVEQKRHIIVPEKFIFDLSQENLKNNGCNKNHSYLMFWAKEAFGDEESAPILDYEPKFDLTVCNIFPPNDSIQEACYIIRLKKFFGKI